MSYTKKELKGFRQMWRQEITNYVTDMFGPDVNLEYEKGGLFQLELDSMCVDFYLNYYTGQIEGVEYGRNQSFGPSHVWRADYTPEAIPEITEGLVSYATDVLAGAAFLRDLQKLHFTVLHPELPSKLKAGEHPRVLEQKRSPRALLTAIRRRYEDVEDETENDYDMEDDAGTAYYLESDYVSLADEDEFW